MGRFVVGDVVVVLFPQTDLQIGKRRPALVVATLRGDDLVLCQITSQSRHEGSAVSLVAGDFIGGQLKVDSFVRPERLFTVEAGVILYAAGRLKPAKVSTIRQAIRSLFD